MRCYSTNNLTNHATNRRAPSMISPTPATTSNGGNSFAKAQSIAERNRPKKCALAALPSDMRPAMRANNGAQ